MSILFYHVGYIPLMIISVQFSLENVKLIWKNFRGDIERI